MPSVFKYNGNEIIDSSGKITAAAQPKGAVIEQFMLPANGQSITVQSGTYTSETVTTTQTLDNTFTKINGSLIDNYIPPAGTQLVLYEFDFIVSYDTAAKISHFGLYVDGTEVTNYRTTIEAQGESYAVNRVQIKYPFIIGDGDVAASGKFATWTSAKDIEVRGREYSSSYQAKVHFTGHWAGAGGVFTTPNVGITAIA